MSQITTLPDLGWKAYFQQQLSLEEWGLYTPARVFAQHRGAYDVVTEVSADRLVATKAMPVLTVGDWLLLDAKGAFHRALERASLFSRKAPGSAAQLQLIAANVDTAFIVCSLNNNFNLSRIERYLALAHQAQVEPLVVLTRADCCTDPESYARKVRTLDNQLLVVAVNALAYDSAGVLKPWCRTGQTIALLGSSGVGKSTLINTLTNTSHVETGAIRDADSKGRHTTTARTIHRMAEGGLLIDTPGMRELQIADCEEGVADTFTEITALAQRCRFGDCQHDNEPGCAVQTAIEQGELDPRRLASYLKLMREQRLNAATLAEKRASDRELGRFYRSVQTASRQRKKGD